MKKKIVISINSAWNLVNFRSGLIKSLIDKKYQVIAIAPPDSYASKVPELGCKYIPIPIDSKGTNPLRDLLLIYRFLMLLRSEKPHIFLGFTIKPNIYGSIAANISKIPVINNIAGLGITFNNNGLLNILIKYLYQFALSRSIKVFFQNNEDRQLFIKSKLIDKDISDLLPGSGVNLTKFRKTSLPNKPRIKFLLISRMLWSKGVGEYVKAASILHKYGIAADFGLLGFVDVENPDAISKQQIKELESVKNVHYLGVSDDVQKEIATTDCVVLPSYYPEGTPRVLLEAAAMGRPIVTTDTPGCRDVVDDGINGFLCKPRDVYDLVKKLQQIVQMSNAERITMGLNSRRKAEILFNEDIIIQKYLEVIENAC